MDMKQLALQISITYEYSDACCILLFILDRKLVSLASPEFREILLPRSLRRWRAAALNIVIIIIFF